MTDKSDPKGKVVGRITPKPPGVIGPEDTTPDLNEPVYTAPSLRELRGPERTAAMRMLLREELAEQEHDRWARWQSYLHSKCAGVEGPMSGLLIHQDDVDHWTRQIRTPYSDLTEREKDSDRKEADNTIALLERLGVIEP